MFVYPLHDRGGQRGCAGENGGALAVHEASEALAVVQAGVRGVVRVEDDVVSLAGHVWKTV